MNQSLTPGTGGDRYVPYSERTGNESIVYFTRDLSGAGGFIELPLHLKGLRASFRHKVL